MIKKIKKIKKIIRKKARKTEPTVAKAKSRAKPVKKVVKKKTADKLFKQTVIKAVVLLLMIALNWAGLSTIGQTVAYFNDPATSTGNIIQAGTLDFSLSSATDFLPNTINKGASSSRMVNVSNEGILGFQYKVSAAQTVGESSLCNGLELVAKLHGITQYTGTLLSLATSPTVFNSGSADWLFTISLPDSTTDSLQDKSCNFKFVYSGWQTDLAEGAGGFSATKEIFGTLNSGHWPITPPTVLSGVVLNEFLPRPENNGLKPNGEWVELYNLSATDTIDLAGYYLMDNYSGSGSTTHKIFVESCRTNTGETTISPHGFLVVYANEGGGSCNSHGFELNNTGDSVRFFNPAGQLIDSYSYTDSDFCSLTPSPGGSNNNSAGTSNCSKIEENKSFARIPDGIGAWVDPVPTPGAKNSLVEVETVFSSIIPVEGGENYVVLVSPLVSPDSVGTGTAGEIGGVSIISTTTPVKNSINNIGQTATTAPADTSATETLPINEPITPAAEPTTIPEPPADQKNPSEATLITQPLAPVPPELVLPEAPVVTDSGSGG